jgi:hypothetical protein
MASMIMSCGARKVVLEKVKIDSTSQVKTKVITKEVVDIDIKVDVVTEELVITPADTTRAIVIDGKRYENAVLSYRKTKDNTLRSEKKNVSNIGYKEEEVKKVSYEKKKIVEKKSSFQLWVLIIVVLAYILWTYVVKRYLWIYITKRND